MIVKNNKIYLVRTAGIGFFLFFSAALFSQELLTEEKAVAQALFSNYSILIAKNDSAISDAAFTLGNAGILPRLDLNAGGSVQGTSINQRFSNGLEVSTSGVTGNGLNASADLGWTLFDGGRMFINYSSLKTNKDLSELNLKAAAENITEQVLINYYDIIRRTQELKASQLALELAKEQLLIIEKKFEIGSASRQEVLQAKIDKNAALSNQLTMQTELENIKTALNRLMGISPEIEYVYDDSKKRSFSKSLDEVIKNADQVNTSLLQAKTDQRLMNLNLKGIKAERYPVLNLNVAYAYNRTSSTAGFALFNQSNGPNAGLTIGWNLFNGSQLNSRIKQAELQIQNSDLIIKDTQALIKANAIVAYRQLLRYRELLELEKENAFFAEDNYKLALERLRLGEANILIVKEANRSYEAAVARLSAASFQTIQAEVQLLRLAGELVK
ncbi:MAG: TolC family protein [Bacteroidia bacterium]